MAAKKVNKEPKKTVEAPIQIAEEVVKSPRNKGVSFAWILLLVGGLAHMLPEQMAPILKWGIFGVSLQLAIGVVSVILALNYILED